MDDTILGDDVALRQLLDLADSCGIAVVLNSSRPIDSVRASIDWTPSGIIGALGTEIELHGARLESWSECFTRFDRARIDRALSGLGFTPHRAELQAPFKVSYEVPAPRRQEARTAIEAIEAPTRIIVSAPTNFDVIPSNAGKGAAALHVAQALGIPTERLVTAGDSANDLDLVTVGRGVVVGNATQELIANLDHGVYRATQAHAAGVLEGLRHHGAPIQERP